MCSQYLSHTGPVPAHSAYALPVHTAQALGCFARNCLRPALSCMHLPGLSRSGSGTLVVLRGADSVGPAFCALLGLSSSGDEVFGECGRCDLSPPPSLPLGFLSVHLAHLLRQMLTVQNPKKSWLAKKPACTLEIMPVWGCDCPLPALPACHWRGMICHLLALFSPLFCELTWQSLRLGL